MSNKRQHDMSLSNRVIYVLQGCDHSILAFLVGILLLTSTICSAELETGTESIPAEVQINEIVNDEELSEQTPPSLSQSRGNPVEYAYLYHSELQRLPYEDINRILRDEQEPIFRRDKIDVRYHHTRSYQPTHEIIRRSTEELAKQSPNILILHGRNITEFINPRQFSTDGITQLDLSENRLRTLLLTDFKKLITANLSHNLLTELPITTNSILKILDLNYNRIKSALVPANTHLKALHLSGNIIENLTALNLTLLTGLETLDLSCNQIMNLETSFFPQLMHNLKYLNLANNRLGSISRETFYNLLSLNTLLLAGNNITYIDYETFLSLPNLQYLDLSHNQLKGESIRALQGIPDLVGLSIAFNPDMGESLQEFVASWSLKEVDASGTGLCQIPAALAQAVRTLKLAHNWFKIINCGDLDSYPLLQHLDLSFSHIEDIEDDAMGRLEFLEILFLDHNKLRKVPVSLPTSLEHLFLQYNQIMDLQVQTFQGLKNLKTLDLSHNKLLYLPALSLPKLLTLNLQASGLQGLNQAIVHSLPHLRDLLLEENPIKCSDLLGIAEWASPCRIAEHKMLDTEQIANPDVGQQQQQQQQQQQEGGEENQQQQQQQQFQMQTVAKIDLKSKFVETHNFYEKFTSSCSYCRNRSAVTRQMLASITQPPSCAIELDDVEEEELTKTTIAQATVTTTTEVEQPTPKILSSTQLATALFGNKVTEHNLETPNAHENSPKIVDTNTESLAGKISNASYPTASMKIPKTVVIANVPMERKFSGIAGMNITHNNNSETKTMLQQQQQSPKRHNQIYEPRKTTNSWMPTTLRPMTSTLDIVEVPPPTTMKTTELPTFGMRMPQTMPTTTNNYVDSYSTEAGSLLEHQRRLEGDETMTTTTATTTNTETTKMEETTFFITSTATTNITMPTAAVVAVTVGRIANKEMPSKRILVENSTKIISSEEKIKLTVPTSTTILKATTPIPQHKHVTLQLHVKDRHLIGTPLLTHHGENLLVAAEEIQNLGNHATTITTTTTTQKPSTEMTIISSTKSVSQNLTKSVESTTMKLIHNLSNTNSSKSSKKSHNEKRKKPSLTMKKMTFTTKHVGLATHSPTHQQFELTQHHHYALNTPRENEASSNLRTTALQKSYNSQQSHYNNEKKVHQVKHSTVNTPIINGHEHELQTFQEHNELEEAAAAAAHASTSAIVRKITKAGASTSNSQQWFNVRKTTGNTAHPGVVVLLSFGLFVVLLIGLLHVYRCDIPWPLRSQRQQPRPYHMHQQQQQQQTHFNDDDGHSFLSYQSSSSNQFQRKWRLDAANKQPGTTVTTTISQQHHDIHQQQSHQQSPFHNLQVRELQQTSAIEPCPKYSKQTFSLSSALGERSNSQTSSSCSPPSSGIFDDEAFCIEMATEVGTAGGTGDSISRLHGDLLPMELLNVSTGGNITRNHQHHHQSDHDDSIEANSSVAFQTSSLDDDTALQQSAASVKLTPKTRKLGLW